MRAIITCYNYLLQQESTTLYILHVLVDCNCKFQWQICKHQIFMASNRTPQPLHCPAQSPFPWSTQHGVTDKFPCLENMQSANRARVKIVFPFGKGIYIIHEAQIAYKTLQLLKLVWSPHRLVNSIYISSACPVVYFEQVPWLCDTKIPRALQFINSLTVWSLESKW